MTFESTSQWRIIDASLNRAGEGLRVVEDYVRLALDDPQLSKLAKTLRHELTAAAAALPASACHAARNTLQDVGTQITTSGEQHRADTLAVATASLKRVEQSLRSLEEYGKLVDNRFAAHCETIRYQVYSLEKAIHVGHTSRQRLSDVRLCVLVDGQDSPQSFKELITTIVEVGVGIIQLRDKRPDDRILVARARQLVQLTRGSRTLAIVNDRADVAALATADGVHLGQDDLSVKDARCVVGTDMLIGVSTHNLDQAEAAVLDGANYIGVGPTFPSQTKKFAEYPGLDLLADVAAQIGLPAFAIGGINADNLADVLATGITRVAVSSAVTRFAQAAEAGLAVEQLLGVLNSSEPKPKTAATITNSLTSDP